ncbi:MAG: nuclear transport factor 2 family protein [Candidatus Limnocylindrales bacterium]|nr:nuclear transport factor 2 family protein [Candidatus Limnocylindrales bacterium]
MTPTSDPTAAYLPALASGRADRVLALFSGEPVIDDPRHGHVVGAAAVRDYVHAQAAWMAEHDFAAEKLRTTVGRHRSVTESLATLTVGGASTELPIAVVGDRPDQGLTAIRVYHSLWPLEGRHRLRPPIIAEDRDLVLPDVVDVYMEALGSANLEKSLSVFESDGYFREPSGGRHEYRGAEGIRAAYGAFYAVGPIHLLHCTIIDDGVACGVEFIAVGWGPRRFEPQAGIGIYERGASGKLHAARVYDDVDVDLGLQPA